MGWTTAIPSRRSHLGSETTCPRDLFLTRARRPIAHKGGGAGRPGGCRSIDEHPQSMASAMIIIVTQPVSIAARWGGDIPEKGAVSRNWGSGRFRWAEKRVDYLVLKFSKRQIAVSDLRQGRERVFGPLSHGNSPWIFFFKKKKCCTPLTSWPFPFDHDARDRAVLYYH